MRYQSHEASSPSHKLGLVRMHARLFPKRRCKRHFGIPISEDCLFNYFVDVWSGESKTCFIQEVSIISGTSAALFTVVVLARCNGR
jgi:hypothetical protein